MTKIAFLPRIRLLWAYFKGRSREVFFEADATTVRTVLAVGSLGWTIGLWWPLHTFDRPAYAWMAAVATEHQWGGAMLLHFLGVAWRTYDVVPRRGWAFAVNLYGVALWTFMGGCITFAVGLYTPSLAIEFTLIVAAWVCLVRTGSNEGKGTP